MRRAAAGAALATALIAASAVALDPAQAAPTGPAASPTPSPTASPTPSGTHLVELPTADLVRVTREADGVTAVPEAKGIFTVLTAGPDTYVLPAAARTGALDPALFDVTDPVLATGSVRVTVNFRPGVTPHPIAGIQTTDLGGGVLDGLITTGSAPAFGAALARPSTLSGVARIAPATPGVGVVSPNYAMETLTINVALPPACTGCALSTVVIDDLDGPYRYNNVLLGVSGSIMLSVPRGHYAAYAEVTGVANETTPAAWLAGDPQFTVSKDSAITLNLGAATTPVTVRTPKPATEVGSADSISRTGVGGGGFGIGLENATGAPYPVYVAPTAKAPTLGTLSYDFATLLDAPSGAAHPYGYQLDFAGQGIVPADHSYVVSAAGLATLHEHFGAVGVAYECTAAAHPWGLAPGGACPALSTPVDRDLYVTADPQLDWTTSTTGYAIGITPTVAVGGRDTETPLQLFRSFTPGEQLDQRWFAHPEAPNLSGGAGLPRAASDGTLSFDTTECAACATGSTLDLQLAPRGTADTTGDLDAADSASYQVSADGAPVQGGSLADSAGELTTTVPLPATARTYRIDYDTTRDAADNPLSSSTQTSWQIPASARRALPAGWVCTAAGNTDCDVVPLLNLVPDLETSAAGALPTGADVGSLQVSQLGGGSVSLRSVTVQISYDGGSSWTTVSAAPAGNGRYTLTLPVPAHSDGFGNLRITATATSGASVTQTVVHAFAVAS